MGRGLTGDIPVTSYLSRQSCCADILCQPSALVSANTPNLAQTKVTSIALDNGLIFPNGCYKFEPSHSQPPHCLQA